MITPLTEWLCQRPLAVTAWAITLVLLGTWILFQVPLEWVPEVELPEVRISAAWPGASPRAVERYVTAPIERVTARVAGTERVESFSEEGLATVVLGVSENVRQGAYVAQINEQLAQLRSVLPDRVRPRLTKSVPEALRNERGFMMIQLIGLGAPDELRRLAEERLAPRLRSLPGVADVGIEGGKQRELLVTLNQDRLAAHGAGPDDVRRALGVAFRDATYGRLRGPGQSWLLLAPAETDVVALRRLVIRPPARPGSPVIHLSDIASVAHGPAPPRSITRIDGNAVITLIVDRARGSHMLSVAQSVRERLDALRLTLPAGTRLLVADDRTEAVRKQLRDLVWRGGLGLLLVVLVLLFMLRSVRSVAVVFFSVAVALAVAFILLEPLGMTLNLLTLAGLVLVFGLLVDNAVVVMEHELRHRRDRAGGIRVALNSVGLALVGGTITTIAVMLPLVFLSNELRVLFIPFGLLVGLTLGASLAIALLLVPVWAQYLPREEAKEQHRRGRLRGLVHAPYRLVARFPKASLVALGLLIGLPVWLLPARLEAPDVAWPRPVERLADLYNRTLGTEAVQAARSILDPALGGITRPFLRQVKFGGRWQFEQTSEVHVRLRFPSGNRIEQADSLISRFERTSLSSPAVVRTLVRVSERQASMIVQFHEAALPTASPYVLRQELIQQAGLLGGIDVSVGGLLPDGYYRGSGANMMGFRLEAYGPNFEVLEALCARLAARLQASSRRVASVDINADRFGFRNSNEVLLFRWDAGAQAQTGATAGMLASVLRPVFSTRFPSFFADLEGETRLPVRVIIADAEATDIAVVMARPLALGDSLYVRLAELADYRVKETPSAIERLDQQYRRYISVDYLGPDQLGLEFLEAELKQFPLPPGYRVQFGNLAFFTEPVQQEFVWVLLGTLTLVYLVTSAVFESWRLPLVVMLSVPCTVVGVGVGFLWTDAPFAEGAFIGTVLLSGIAVNNSILLADRYRQLRRLRRQTAPSRLIRLAVRDRLRPMWTTTLTSIVTMVPLLIFPEGGNFWTGLAVTVTGGLLASTLLAPLATVALVSALATSQVRR